MRNMREQMTKIKRFERMNYIAGICASREGRSVFSNLEVGNPYWDRGVRDYATSCPVFVLSAEIVSSSSRYPFSLDSPSSCVSKAEFRGRITNEASPSPAIGYGRGEYLALITIIYTIIV